MSLYPKVKYLAIYNLLLFILIFFEYSFISIMLRMDSDISLYISMFSYKLLTYGLLTIVLLYIHNNKFSFNNTFIFILLFFSIIKLIAGGSVSNTLLSVPLFIYTYYLVRHQLEVFVIALKILIILSSIVMWLQFLGLTDIVYMLSHSSHDSLSDFVYLQASGEYLPAHQHRPHGVFASTIQLTLFSSFSLISLYWFKKEFSVVYYLLLSTIFILAGSTSGVLFITGSLLMSIFNKKMLITFFFGVFLVYFISVYFPVFLEQNFKLEYFFASFDSRVNLEKGHSFYTKYPHLSDYLLIIVYILIPIILVSSNFKVKFLFKIAPIIIIPFSLLLLHPIINDMRFSLLVALIVSIIMQEKYRVFYKKIVIS